MNPSPIPSPKMLSNAIAMSPAAPIGWTPARVAEMERLWRENHSFSEIARTLGGGLTRNAVIGKAHRMGLTRPPEMARAMAEIQPKSRKRQEVTASARWKDDAGEKKGLPVEKVETAKPLMSRVFGRECAWPVDEGMACCAPVVESGQYCAAHKARAYTGPGKPFRGLAEFGQQSGDPERWFGEGSC